jgi:uncharacterized protein involved in exopolysaccharide biosynthesis
VVRQVAAGTSVRDIVNILYRRKWFVLVIALPIMLAGSLSLLGQTGSYTAVSRVVVELAKVDLPLWNTSGRTVDYDRELSTMFNIAMSVPVGESAAIALQDSIPVIQELNPALLDLHEPGRLQEFLTNGLDVSVIGESSILEFRFSSIHPRISMMAVGALRDAFVEFQVYGRKSVKATTFYEEQLSMVRNELDSLLVARSEVLNEAGYSSLDDEMQYSSGQLINLETKLSNTIVARRSLELEYSLLTKHLQGDPREFPMGPDANRSTTLIHWMTTVAKHDDELNTIRTINTDESQPVKRLRQLIDDSVKVLAQEERKYVESVGLSLASLKETEEVLRHQVESLQEKNMRAPGVYRKVSLLDSEISSLGKLLEGVQEKLGEVRLNQFADERVSSVVVLSEPELVAVFSGGKTMVYLAMIFVFALALGIAVAFVVENMDHRVYKPSDVEENLKLPVFASVTRVE